MHPALASTDHRPWPLPGGPWIWRQTWQDLLFMHWPVPRAALERWLPDGLTLDAFDGQAWIGVIPFRMTGVSGRWMPDIPGMSSFDEINVRTYVTRDDRPGVWFFSLDASNLLAVWAARRWYKLPYHHATTSVQRLGDRVTYRSVRRTERAEALDCDYEALGPASAPERGTLDHWLIERYCLYAADGEGRLFRGDIQHAPWQIRAARATLSRNTLLDSLDLTVEGPPLLHFADRIDVVGWNPKRIQHRRSGSDGEGGSDDE